MNDTAVEREVMEYDVIIVGAGPAGLACAIRLKQLKTDLMVAVIEKGAEVGAHILSGAVIEPEPLDELLPGWRDKLPPTCVPVEGDELAFLTANGRYRFPTPPQQRGLEPAHAADELDHGEAATRPPASVSPTTAQSAAWSSATWASIATANPRIPICRASRFTHRRPCWPKAAADT